MKLHLGPVATWYTGEECWFADIVSHYWSGHSHDNKLYLLFSVADKDRKAEQASEAGWSSHEKIVLWPVTFLLQHMFVKFWRHHVHIVQVRSYLLKTNFLPLGLFTGPLTFRGDVTIHIFVDFKYSVLSCVVLFYTWKMWGVSLFAPTFPLAKLDYSRLIFFPTSSVERWKLIKRWI